MRRPFIAGNWKMNLNRAESVALVSELAKQLGDDESVEVGVCPPSLYLEAAITAADGSVVGVGAQNMHHEAKGAFTGELAPGMLVDIGCRYVILGHSERRQLFGETNKSVNEKLHAALMTSMTPIVCLGETLEQREAGQTEAVVQEQFEGSFAGLTADQMAGVVIAYEPIWAIGTGKTASPQQAEEVHAYLRKIIENSYNPDVAGSVRIQYGGSVKPSNASDLLGQENIDGALVGGASLKADDFLAIIAAAK